MQYQYIHGSIYLFIEGVGFDVYVKELGNEINLCDLQNKRLNQGYSSMHLNWGENNSSKSESEMKGTKTHATSSEDGKTSQVGPSFNGT